MTTEVLRAHNILLPAPHRIRPAASHRRPSSGNHPGATRRSPPAPAAGRRHHGRKAARPAAAEVYAGPAFSTSPEPSSLPLPQFPVRKAMDAAVIVDDAATRDLRRILRLE